MYVHFCSTAEWTLIKKNFLCPHTLLPEAPGKEVKCSLRSTKEPAKFTLCYDSM